jgi:hypothetical protein
VKNDPDGSAIVITTVPCAGVAYAGVAIIVGSAPTAATVKTNATPAPRRARENDFEHTSSALPTDAPTDGGPQPSGATRRSVVRRRQSPPIRSRLRSREFQPR